MAPTDTSASANLTKVRENIRTGVNKIDEIRKKRGELNTDAQSILANLENDYGIHRDAVRLAIRVRDMDPAVREQFLIALAIAMESVGLPLQGELFDSAKGLDRLAEIASKPEEDAADDGADGEQGNGEEDGEDPEPPEAA